MKHLEITGDVDSETEILEVYTLLTENYVEDDDFWMVSALGKGQPWPCKHGLDQARLRCCPA